MEYCEVQKLMLHPTDYQRMERALDMILRWDPKWKPHKGWLPSDAFAKLEQLGLMDEFRRQEQRR